jgi:hypothetical protein
MEKEDVFLDTCIFFSYAYIFEDFSKYSERLFVLEKYNIYTSETVKDEIAVRKERRDKAYPLFLAALIKGSSLQEISENLGMYLSKNDLGHFKSLRDHLISKNKLPEILSEFRRWKLISDARFRKAESSLIGIVPKCLDTYMKDLIRSIIDNDSDSKIMIEVFEWSKSVNDPKFITIDSTDIYTKSAEILAKLVDFKFLNEEPFKIFHVVEFAGP